MDPYLNFNLRYNSLIPQRENNSGPCYYCQRKQMIPIKNQYYKKCSECGSVALIVDCMFCKKKYISRYVSAKKNFLNNPCLTCTTLLHNYDTSFCNKKLFSKNFVIPDINMKSPY